MKWNTVPNDAAHTVQPVCYRSGVCDLPPHGHHSTQPREQLLAVPGVMGADAAAVHTRTHLPPQMSSVSQLALGLLSPHPHTPSQMYMTPVAAPEPRLAHQSTTAREHISSAAQQQHHQQHMEGRGRRSHTGSSLPTAGGRIDLAASLSHGRTTYQPSHTPREIEDREEEMRRERPTEHKVVPQPPLTPPSPLSKQQPRGDAAVPAKPISQIKPPTQPNLPPIVARTVRVLDEAFKRGRHAHRYPDNIPTHNMYPMPTNARGVADTFEALCCCMVTYPTGPLKQQPRNSSRTTKERARSSSSSRSRPTQPSRDPCCASKHTLETPSRSSRLHEPTWCVVWFVVVRCGSLWSWCFPYPRVRP